MSPDAESAGLAMYRNKKQWSKIRERISNGASLRGLSRELGIGRSTLRKMVDLPCPPPFGGASARLSKLEPYKSTVQQMLAKAVTGGTDRLLSARGIHRHLVETEGFAGSYTIVKQYVRQIMIERPDTRAAAVRGRTRAQAARGHLKEHIPHRPRLRDIRRSNDREWLRAAVQKDASRQTRCRDVRDDDDTSLITSRLYDGRLSDRNRAVVILSRRAGICARTAMAFLGISKCTYYSYVRLYRDGGDAALFARKIMPHRKFDDERIKEAVFRTLHEPPTKYGINRTSWIMPDLSRVLGDAGFPAGRDVIRQITRAAGYKWRKARIQLTSQDPAYREKLAAVQAILSNLSADEAFFSIDEFGPFAVKMKQGLRLDPPGPHRTVPQWQKSKGCMIMTAALELSGNQITHFYSERKNTTEMIRMMDVLVEQYADRRTIYLSWDAASWHVAKKLMKRIEEHNATAEVSGRPRVATAPLPAGAQFLNVIESVFSGMARAVIHNSDYASADAARAAIDRYFTDRNQQFRENPKRAGNRIWGKERVAPTFSDSNNCKDPRWR